MTWEPVYPRLIFPYIPLLYQPPHVPHASATCTHVSVPGAVCRPSLSNVFTPIFFFLKYCSPGNVREGPPPSLGLVTQIPGYEGPAPAWPGQCLLRTNLLPYLWKQSRPKSQNSLHVARLSQPSSGRNSSEVGIPWVWEVWVLGS